MAECLDQRVSNLVAMVHEQAQTLQDLVKQQAEAEEASGYQVRGLHKQVISLRKQREDDAQEIDALRKQLATTTLQNDDLRSSVQQLTEDVRDSATNAATDVLDQYNKTADKMLNIRLNKLEEKTAQAQRDVDEAKRGLDDVDVSIESLGSRLRTSQEDIQAINSDIYARAVADSAPKGRSVAKMRERLDKVEGQLKAMEKVSASLTKQPEGVQDDLSKCKTTFYYFNEATKPHVEKKSR